MNLPALRRDERIRLTLRALYEDKEYRLFRMSSFEEYDFYMQNKSFLTGDDIITFTGSDGRLMALRPDVTLSIVKGVPAGATCRNYYCENVFRRSHASGKYKEISQMGLEFIGGDGVEAEAEVLRLAAQSLAVVGKGVLDLSHMGLIELMLAPFGSGDELVQAREALHSKSPHLMQQAADLAGLPDSTTQSLMELAELSGPFETAMETARKITKGVPGAGKILNELETLSASVAQTDTELRLDFSIINDTAYYNGLMFKGFVQGVPHSVLSGGRYDNLLRRFEKHQGAIGFALYLDDLEPCDEDTQEVDPMLNVALPKGRLGDAVYALFEKAGLSCEGSLDQGRKLVFEDENNKVRYFLVKPSDVHSYVEHGVADVGVVGRDVLLESGANVLELLDLKLGQCRLAVAGPADFVDDPGKVLRVATKYPNITRRYYAAQSRSVDIISLHGSIELAPITGLSDLIVDIVETGSTLVENDLAVLTDVEPSSARLIANRSSWRFKQDTIQELTRNLQELI